MLCQWLAYLLRVPSILLVLIVGFGLGQLVPRRGPRPPLLFAGVTLTVGIILFEGGLSLRIRHLEGVRTSVWRLCSVTVLIAWALISLTAWSLGFDVRVALLVGAILVVTGPTVINPILRQLRPTRRVTSLLRWEGILVDPIGAVLGLRIGAGLTVRRTHLSAEFTLDDFTARFGDRAVVMFVIDDGRIQVAHQDKPLPRSDAALVALVALVPDGD